MNDSYMDALRQMLGGIGGGMVGVANASNAGTYAGIERSRQAQFGGIAGRIQMSGAEITAARNQQGAFTRAMAQEYAQAMQDVQRESSWYTYMQGKQWHTWLDPDMEMDIGL